METDQALRKVVREKLKDLDKESIKKIAALCKAAKKKLKK